MYDKKTYVCCKSCYVATTKLRLKRHSNYAAEAINDNSGTLKHQSVQRYIAYDLTGNPSRNPI